MTARLTKDFKQVKARMRLLPPGMISRFAPAPTGYLHLGHLASAIYTWALARSCGARIILRIEDHDRSRYREPYEKAILEDLADFGLLADAGVAAIDEPSQYRQSDCFENYERSLQELYTRGLVYPCTCSRKKIKQRFYQHRQDLFYPGICRLNLEEETKLDPKADDRPNTNWRLKIPRTQHRFEDMRLGLQNQTPAAQCGDLLLKDSQGQWTYQFSSVLDDLRQGVNLIIRGEDILPSVARQKMLMEAIGASQNIVYCHHPLIRDDKGDKLSKSLRSYSIRDSLADGLSREEIIGRAAYSVGILSQAKSISMVNLMDLIHE